MRQGTEGGSALAGLLGGSLWAFIGSEVEAMKLAQCVPLCHEVP